MGAAGEGEVRDGCVEGQGAGWGGCGAVGGEGEEGTEWDGAAAAAAAGVEGEAAAVVGKDWVPQGFWQGNDALRGVWSIHSHGVMCLSLRESMQGGIWIQVQCACVMSSFLYTQRSIH